MNAPSHLFPGHRPGRTLCAKTASRGFTLVELVVATSIIALLASIALSLVGGALHASRASAARSSLLATYSTAIRHSSVRGVHVVACPAMPDGGCRDSIDWSHGWILFEDRDLDRQHNESERVVAAFPELGARVHLRSTTGRRRLVFQPNGGNSGSNVTMTLCDGRGPRKATQLLMANDGRIRERPAPSSAALPCMQPQD